MTGPFEVLSRLPNSTYRIYAKTMAPVRDVNGLRLIRDAILADAPPLDALHVPGGHGGLDGRRRSAGLNPAAGVKRMQHFLGVYRRPDLRRGGPT
jgi:hypothetical protein